jgi:hypothetical protein
MEVLAFTYEADYHCTDCACKKFGNKVMHSSENLEDDEGNAPHPIFSTDEYDETAVCGTCGAELFT